MKIGSVALFVCLSGERPIGGAAKRDTLELEQVMRAELREKKLRPTAMDNNQVRETAKKR